MFKVRQGESGAMADLTVVPKRIGGSLAVFIPAEVARAEGIEEGKPVKLTVRPLRSRADVLGKHRGIGSFHRAREGLWDDA